MNTWGRKIGLSIFGESHGNGIGIVIDGIPSGTALDLEFIRSEMQRRAPGRDDLSTPRSEADEVEILSGFFDGVTTGTPLCGIIRNTNTKSKDYNKSLIRPGHADYTGLLKYGESHDYRGGGHFSGRITAPLVFAGAVAKQVLSENGIAVGSHIQRIGNVSDKAFDPVHITGEDLSKIRKKAFPVVDDEAGKRMRNEILAHRSRKDSVGGIVECAAVGVPAGVGEPFFGSLESVLSSMMFSIPAVKGVEFGAGFGFADMSGKEANDEFYVQDGKVRTYTNNNAGINGGITNGMPVLCSVVIKPTPSIASPQRTVDISGMEETDIEIHGRHDPCIVHRAAVVVESAMALSIMDLLI